jgi:hypothetical protein
MPEGLNGHAVLFLETFALHRDLTDNLHPDPLEIHLPEITQMRSWNSATKNVNDIIGVVPSHGYYHCDVSANSAGIPILDHNFFRNNQLSIVISNPLNETGKPTRAGEDLYAEQDEFAWTMILTIICYDESVPL